LSYVISPGLILTWSTSVCTS